MKIGYARVSTDDQNVSLQLDALHAADCDRIFTDQLSGSTTKRPGLDEAIAALPPGDVLTVWRPDRLGRTMRHLVNTVHEFGERGIGFQSITEAMETTTARGELLFHIAGALAQFERRLNAERSRACRSQTREASGTPCRLTPEKIAHARKAIESGERSVTGMAFTAPHCTGASKNDRRKTRLIEGSACRKSGGGPGHVGAQAEGSRVRSIEVSKV